MESKEFKGVIPPILTLFNEQGRVDEEKQRNYVEYLVKAGIHGLFVCGTFGCGIMMTVEEHKKVVEIVIDQVKGRIPIIVHVGSTSTDISIALAKNAEALGADAISAVTPFYYKHSDEAIVNFFNSLVKIVNIPVLAYNNVTTSGYLITPNVAIKLAKVGVRGIKDTGPIENFYLMKTRMEQKGFDFQFIIGTCGHWLPAASTGVKAMISGTANSFPEVVLDMYNTTVEKGSEAAAELQMKIIRLRDLQLIGGKILTTMAVLELRGISAGYPKRPFIPLSETAKQRIREAVIEESLEEIIKK